MGRKADKFVDLFVFKNWWRYWKVGTALTILYGLVIGLIQAILKFFGVAFGEGQLMASLQVGGVGVAIAFIVGLFVQLAIGGFVIEWIENGRNAFFRWVNR